METIRVKTSAIGVLESLSYSLHERVNLLDRARKLGKVTPESHGKLADEIGEMLEAMGSEFINVRQELGI